MSATNPEQAGPLRVEKAVYGGDGLARTPAGEVVLLPFVLPCEQVEPDAASTAPGALRILRPSPARVDPRCIHSTLR